MALGPLVPAAAAAAPLDRKLAVISAWTQIQASSYESWNAARLNQGAWARYQFDWVTDYCSASPDQPLGFDFRAACSRHDFGYRNYAALRRFDANKARLDEVFYADMRRACAWYNRFIRPSCYAVAWVYYQAVRAFGSVAIQLADLEPAEELKAEGESDPRAHANSNHQGG
jgi:hypothetical protein